MIKNRANFLWKMERKSIIKAMCAALLLTSLSIYLFPVSMTLIALSREEIEEKMHVRKSSFLFGVGMLRFPLAEEKILIALT